MSQTEPSPEVLLTRMSIYDRAGRISAYLLMPVDAAYIVRPELHPQLEETYSNADLPSLVLDRTTFLLATPGILEGRVLLPAHAGRLGLVLTALQTQTEGMVERLRELRRRGVLLALLDYRGTDRQRSLAGFFTHLILDMDAPDLTLEAIPEGSPAKIVLHHAEPGMLEPWPDEVHGVLGSLAGQPATNANADLLPNEITCLEAVRLLGKEDVDIDAVSTVLGTDPALVLRVLRLVNASTEGLSHRVDSLRRAIVLLGPQKVTGMVMASLISSTIAHMDNLWLMIARAIACRELCDGDDSAYTVGLLSALSTERGIPPQTLAERTRLSTEAYDALVLGEGRLGHVLRAVVAHDQEDTAALEATGIPVSDVARAFLVAIPEALDAVLAAATPSPVEV